jgi:hypothetical protein
VKRWLVLTLGLGLAGIAGYSLLTLARGSTRSASAPSAEAVRPAPAPDDHIDQASRDALREILRDADDGGRHSP